MARGFSRDEDLDLIYPTDSPNLMTFSSPETPATPFMGRGLRPFLLQSPTQSTDGGSTLTPPMDLNKWKWSPVYPGIHAEGGSRTSFPSPGLVNKSESGKGLGLNISNSTLSPGHPRRSRLSWFQELYMGKRSMVICLLVGLLLAIGHHLFYKSLVHKTATQTLQLRYLRIGSIFAISSKSFLIVAAILAYRQRAWMVVKDKAHSVRAVDTLFGAAENLMELLSFTMLKNDVWCLAIAIFIWTSPLIIVFSANTLSIELITKGESGYCPSIRTLNFTHEETNEWDKPRTPVNQTRIGLSLSTWNSTMEYEKRNWSDPNFFDYWTSSSQQFQVVASQSLWGDQPLMRENASQEICGIGWNCSAVVTFVAPGYNCTELARGRNSPIRALDGQLPPFNLSELAPSGNYTYIAAATGGAYPAQLLSEVKNGGMPLFGPPYPEQLGSLRTDPVIWVGYTAVKDLQRPLSSINKTTPEWNNSVTPIVFGCVHHQTKYTIQFNWTTAGETYKVLNRTYMGKMINTTFLPNEKIEGYPLLDITVAEPKENYVLPRDKYRYRLAAAYYSMGARLREMINGTCNTQNVALTQAINTRLMDPHQSLPVKNMQTKLRGLYEDLIVSLINNPQFLVVSWAKKPWKRTGLAIGQEETNFPCEREHTINAFVYHEMTLWSIYLYATGFTLISVMLGFIAAREDDRGHLREMIFSEIVSATRGQNLDEVRWDQHMDKKRVKVIYQKLPGDDPGRFVLKDNARMEQMST